MVWDEDDYGSQNHVAMVGMSTYTRPGAVLSRPYTHYALLRAIEDALGYRPLGRASSASPLLGHALGISS